MPTTTTGTSPLARADALRDSADLITEVTDMVAPVWPLKDYVAVNPYMGFSGQPFIEARGQLKRFSDAELLMPVAYYRRRFDAGAVNERDLLVAIEELELGEVITADEIMTILRSPVGGAAAKAPPRFRSAADLATRQTSTAWMDFVRDEIGKICGAHYDRGQATWSSPWSGETLFAAWRAMATIDRTPEAFGLAGFREFVSGIPESAVAAVAWLLDRVGGEPSVHKPFLLCQAYSVPGWFAWTSYQTRWTSAEAAEANDFAGLLAIRLAYDVMIAEAVGIDFADCMAPGAADKSFLDFDRQCADHTVARYVLQRATESAFRDELIRGICGPSADESGGREETERPSDANSRSPLSPSIALDVPDASPTPSDETRRSEASRPRASAQLVFCIDVRSERIRRQLEQTSEQLETFGFAGFFGMPIEYVTAGLESGDAHLPVLLKPQFQLREASASGDQAGTGNDSDSALATRRTEIRSWRSLWKKLQTSAVGCFPFVETTGFWFGWKLLGRSAGFAKPTPDGRHDGAPESSCGGSGPTLQGLAEQGLGPGAQVDLVAGVLTNLGLTRDFARLVVFCGHGSRTENNPLAAGLDCGACGGHSGEPNARMLAKLLGLPEVRAGLVRRGIEIPADTHFLPAIHNTTTDAIEFFDVRDLPATHRDDLEQLRRQASTASANTLVERMPTVASPTPRDVLRRARDWSELRPEWGLAGNAAFVVGPRSITANLNLDARSFLHSYDSTGDPEGAVLEGIMTAPMIVAHWINMQYYASTVDNATFGSGNKTVHNVVGKFGILSGNGGDLQTGLPEQSLHTGTEFQHHPLRLQVVIAAPRESIDRIVAVHENVAEILHNDWVHLVAIEAGVAHRHTREGWTPLPA